jgi:DNA repair exonuclease SbcCD ATPase subunit
MDEQVQEVPQSAVESVETPPSHVEEHAVEPSQTILLDELEWYRTQYAQVVSQLQELQRQLEEYETAAMDDEERAEWELERRRQHLEEQQRQLAEVQYAQSLYQYYSGFVPRDWIKGRDPSEWQHSVLTRMKAELDRLRKENEALRRSAAPGQAAPKVGTVSGPAKGKKTLWEMTPEERETLMKRALMGMTSPEDFPPVE